MKAQRSAHGRSPEMLTQLLAQEGGLLYPLTGECPREARSFSY